MCKVDHENVVKLYGLTLKPMGMVLELCEEGDLLKYLENSSLLPPDVFTDRLKLKFGTDIARGMCHLHSQVPPIIRNIF